ncbi:aminotransferase class V-fold PLP-dependent enzyme [Cytobacillus gottheilii]|uniref:aminotransferase class V-fold PLP-dependent enzyme n=1 Tax=Cytobacillus gottheilii TaxID=859144 RepID=UPI0009B9FA2E|nr:aminotransferase class V-fold PLP-dependent enzyme [Cytobacillus gottheilii]
MKDISLIYKVAADEDEYKQIYELNYQTFVEEIPQHQTNTEKKLIDQFDDENTYIIAKDGTEVVGMIAVRANRPFSLDRKLDNVDSYLPKGARPCEIRLLSVKEKYRSTFVFFQLCEMLVSYCLEKDYNLALISGTLRQTKLYKRIGFTNFGPEVGKEDARFQPMYLTKERFEQNTRAFKELMRKKTAEAYSFLPGPVPMDEEVTASLSRSPLSHRDSEFTTAIRNVSTMICELTHAQYAEVVLGTGTLANDIIAAQLSRMPGTGLVLANGEFGYRLIDHASRMGLHFETIQKDWNIRIHHTEIEAKLQENPSISWVWTVHCETSTGYLYDIDRIQDICRQFGAELCVDSCSSVGTIPVNLKDIYLATAVSGKGLGAYPGLGIILHREKIRPDVSIPRYLDLGLYALSDRVPFTHSSNLLFALETALNKHAGFDNTMLGIEIKNKLIKSGFFVLGTEEYSPHVITIQLPKDVSSQQFGDRLKKKLIYLSYESKYLLDRNWIQVAIMGKHSRIPALRAIKSMIQEYSAITQVRHEIG